MISWQRIVYYLGLALVEATPPALVLTLIGGNAWGALIGVALAGALADWIVLRRLPLERQSLVLVGSGLICGLWVVKGQVVGGYGPLGDWSQALGAIFSVSHPRAAIAYFSLLTALYCFWRGTRLTMHDSLSIHRVFRVVAFSLMLIVGLGFFGVRGTEAVATASTEVLTFFVVGLITMALASATEDREAGLHKLGWRGMLILCGAVALVLVLGLLIGSLFFAQVAEVGRTLLQILILLVTLIVAPFLIVIAAVLAWLLNLLDPSGALRRLAPLNIPSGMRVLNQWSGLFGGLPSWLSAILQVLCGVVPVLLLLALLVLARRRRRRQRDEDEERESLWSWGGLAGDLRGLLAHMRKPNSDGGLRAALARLRGGDPIHRIRRSYIRLLLVGEARDQPRAAPQTPREYTPAASAMLPTAAQPVDTLTNAYERARYFPAGTTDADAEAAERAWAAIEQADRHKQ